MKDKELFCAFCGKPKELARRLVSGPNGTFICDECIEICKEVLSEDEADNTEVKTTFKSSIKDLCFLTVYPSA